MAGFMTTVFQAFPDMLSSQQHILTSGNILVEEWIATATFQGEWAGMPPTGKGGSVPHLSISEFEGDKIKKTTVYLDNVTFMIVVGLMPPPELPPLVPSFTLPDPEPTGLSPVDMAMKMTEVWNSHDMIAIAKHYSQDVDALLVPLGVPLSRDALMAGFELYFLTYSDLKQEIVRSVDLGDGWVLMEAIVAGTNDGPYFGGPTTGRYSETRLAWIVQIDAEGLCTYFRAYWDELGTLIQLGLFPPPEPSAVSPASWGQLKSMFR